MNYLITGGCGFIGSNYINHIFDNSKINKIVNLDALYYCASKFNINENVRNSDKYIFIEGNLNDYNLLVDIIKKYNITHIIHFAAQSHVDNSFNESLIYTEDNVKGTHTLLEAIKNTNKNIFLLHFSTDEVYGESDNNEMTEKSILCPTNPYSASKAAAEMYVQAYIKSYNLKVIISRGNNVFGYNQYPEKLIPKFIKLLKENKKCTIHGNGSSVRNFIFIDDVNTAVDFIINKGTLGEIYNIGSDHCYEKSVIEITKILIEKICNNNDYDKYIEYVDDRPFNDKRYLISNDKLKELGWKQNISFDEGLNRVLEHYNKTSILLLNKINYNNNNYEIFNINTVMDLFNYKNVSNYFYIIYDLNDINMETFEIINNYKDNLKVKNLLKKINPTIKLNKYDIFINNKLNVRISNGFLINNNYDLSILNKINDNKLVFIIIKFLDYLYNGN
jgi:dTDP-glucose 4,6-dehydratase